MAKTPDTFFFTFVLALALGFSSALIIFEHEKALSTYIVHLEKPESLEVFNDRDLDTWYASFMPTSLQTSDQELTNRIVHSYRNLFAGFAVKLTAAEAKALTLVDGVVSVRPQQEYKLHTTHTPSFLGLHQNVGLWKDSNLGKGVIIGVLDTGIFPDHPSFSDEGMLPPPAKWKGGCDFNGTLCNNKLIGAKNFAQEGIGAAPYDEEGHGTHTSSTAAGNFVGKANALGQANGTASGIAPHAHIAMYQVCAQHCYDADILAAMDAAIGDGVDVLSLSLGGESTEFYRDVIAIGAFQAIQKGIFVSCSAGNAGPGYYTLSNEAPWILTVGASTVDRIVKATARLGNGAEYDGESLFQPADFNSSELLPLVYPGSNGNPDAQFCKAGSLRDTDVKGKVVLCRRGGGVGRIAKGQEVKEAGGAAMIEVNDQLSGFSTLADAHVVPATSVSYTAGLDILAYINSTPNPTATIVFKGTAIGDLTAPAMASFSSRGPNIQSSGILKPDITGPGVNILAAWPFALDDSTHTKANFNIISGTSMSCPHLSGIAALLKSSHPDWSPAAIKSAIMTSADAINLEKKPIIDGVTGLAADIFAVGAGHVNPSRAQNPGLIYDLTPENYIPYLCGLGYSDQNIKTIVQTDVQCSRVSAISEAQLNYPSFSLILGSTPQNYTRTVTNVGPVNSTYTYKLDHSLEGVDITVTPVELTFSETSRTANYTVAFSLSATGTGGKAFSQGALTWSSGQFSVRSPIAVIFS